MRTVLGGTATLVGAEDAADEETSAGAPPWGRLAIGVCPRAAAFLLEPDDEDGEGVVVRDLRLGTGDSPRLTLPEGQDERACAWLE